MTAITCTCSRVITLPVYLFELNSNKLVWPEQDHSHFTMVVPWQGRDHLFSRVYVYKIGSRVLLVPLAREKVGGLVKISFLLYIILAIIKSNLDYR